MDSEVRRDIKSSVLVMPVDLPKIVPQQIRRTRRTSSSSYLA
jgi:hypothetical protein